MKLGDKIRTLREMNRLMQRQVGAVIDVDSAFISKVEKNEKPLNRNHLKKLAVLFNVKEDELQTLWLADKVRSVIKDDNYAKKSIELVLKDFKL